MRELATYCMQVLHSTLQAFNLRLFAFVAISASLLQGAHSQIPYTGHLSELRIQELHTMATSLHKSVDSEKYPCDSYYDYVCGRNVPLYSVLGNMPHLEELIRLQGELENDPEKFPAKEKMLDFFISCNTRNNVEQCYRQTFVFFKPIFGYIITKNYLDVSSHEHENFMEVLKTFLAKSEITENFRYNPIRGKLVELQREFRSPQSYFRINYLNQEYRDLLIYRDSYEHNMRHLELYRRQNSTYESGTPRTMLDWSLYVYQSRNKPISFYFATLTPHLWMSLYNTTERFRNPLYFQQISECLKMPQFVNMLEEARIMALIYYKSIQNAWQDYSNWIRSSPYHTEIFDQENNILRKYYLDNKRFFFTLYAQNFCDFGKPLAENVFYLGMYDVEDFRRVYSCPPKDTGNKCHVV